jgi:hypothetical protein
MRNMRKHTDHYEKFLLVPQGMEVRIEGFTVIELDSKHFGSAANRNQMLYMVDNWEEFAGYEFMLMYHLDALVFLASFWIGATRVTITSARPS